MLNSVLCVSCSHDELLKETDKVTILLQHHHKENLLKFRKLELGLAHKIILYLQAKFEIIIFILCKVVLFEEKL